MRQAEVSTGTTPMIRSTCMAALAACSLLAPSAPLLAASPAVPPVPSPAAGTQAASAHPAEKYLGDVRLLSDKMYRDGCWLGGSGYGYGYGCGVPLGSVPAGNAAGYGW